uniref:Histone deacetylase 8 n=1 Tax=Ciona savignyi TaxID=51511 RepID=H2YUW5_CIOSA
VAYMLSKFIPKSDEFIPTNNRNAMVHSLIESCGLLKHLSLVASVKASFEELSLFHSQDYLNYLKEENECDDLNESFGFAYDCPLKPGIYEYCQEVAGASISAAKLLCSGHFQVAINWLGGWHHAKRSEAAGYCYVNDCVLSILQLRKTFGRVLYVDLDLHHGDGVQDAFCGTNKVLTFSVHKYEAGFFPGSGSIDDIGIGRGFRYSLNLPLKDGITDVPFIDTCCKILTEIKFRFKPLAIVIQAGADGLNEDPMASFNLTPKSLSSCVQFVLKWGLPTLILGGGGYNESNVARCWTRITADILNIELPMEIPEDDYFTSYGPSFDFEVIEGMKKDQNSKEYLKEMTDNIFGNLTKLT